MSRLDSDSEAYRKIFASLASYTSAYISKLKPVVACVMRLGLGSQSSLIRGGVLSIILPYITPWPRSFLVRVHAQLDQTSHGCEAPQVLNTSGGGLDGCQSGQAQD